VPVAVTDGPGDARPERAHQRVGQRDARPAAPAPAAASRDPARPAPAAARDPAAHVPAAGVPGAYDPVAPDPVAQERARASVEQIRRMLVGYLAAPGYAEMFVRAGHGDLVGYARRRPHPRELLRAIPPELVEEVAIVGGRRTVVERLRGYGAAVDEVAVLPCCTPYDPAGAHTLRVLERVVHGDAAP
jgi:hypothetical protein